MCHAETDTIPIPRHATATGCLTPINGRISAHLAAPRPFYNSTEQRPLQATDALHADEHAIKKAALQARPHTIQFQSNLLSNQPLRKSKQNPSKCTFRFFGHFTTSRRNSLKHRGFRPLTAHSTLHVSFYRPYEELNLTQEQMIREMYLDRRKSEWPQDVDAYMITTEELEDITGLCRKTFERMRERGELECVKLGHKVRYSLMHLMKVAQRYLSPRDTSTIIKQRLP